jgi:hypothetical protein
MVTNETLFHKNPVTGEQQVIGLGWLDDSMSLGGPSEEDKNYIADTGSSPASMMAQTTAYRESMYQLVKKVIPMYVCSHGRRTRYIQDIAKAHVLKIRTLLTKCSS